MSIKLCYEYFQNAAQLLKYSKTKELEAKKKILENNKHLQELYKHLVASKLLSAQDFWSEYYQNVSLKQVIAEIFHHVC